MAKDVNPPRGMRDFLPAEKRKRDHVLSRIRSTYLARGFQEIETPALEDLERLTSGQGGDNEKLAYRVMKRGAELEQALAQQDPDAFADLGLRYDLTVPLTRYYATNRAKLPAVFKAIQAGPVWRAERPQKGRYRQFVQCDIDIIGDASGLAEIELLSASLAALDELGLTDAVIRVNHRALLASALDGMGVAEADRGTAMIIIDKLDKIFADGVVAELREKFNNEIANAAAVWLASIQNQPQAPDELAHVFEAIESSKPGRLRFDPTLVRGMGYYTGPIFEIEHPGSGSAIGGGGRYDGMVGRWLGTDVAAVGISIGFERVVDMVSDEVLGFSAGGVILVVDNDAPATLANALRLQQALIAEGDQVRIEARPKKLGNLLESLSAEGYNRWLAVNEDSTGALDLAALRPIS